MICHSCWCIRFAVTDQYLSPLHCVVLTSKRYVLLLSFADIPPKRGMPGIWVGSHFLVNEWAWAKESDASSMVALATLSPEDNFFVICASFVNSLRTRTKGQSSLHPNDRCTVPRLNSHSIFAQLLNATPCHTLPLSYTPATLNIYKWPHAVSPIYTAIMLF